MNELETTGWIYHEPKNGSQLRWSISWGKDQDIWINVYYIDNGIWWMEGTHVKFYQFNVDNESEAKVAALRLVYKRLHDYGEIVWESLFASMANTVSKTADEQLQFH